MAVKSGLTILCTVLGVTVSLQAQTAGPGDLDMRTTGYLMIDGGYISETEDMGMVKWEHEPFGSFTGGIRFEAQPTDRFRLVVNPELKSRHLFPIQPGVFQGEAVQRVRYDIYLEEAKGTWLFGDPARPRLGLEFGYLLYVDNADSRVLGNYLFRSMIYPSMLFTKMDNTAAYLFGLHAESRFFDGRFRNHLFLLSEVQHYPYFDVSLAYSGSLAIGKALEIGAGFKAVSLLPIHPSVTTPKGTPAEGVGFEDNTYKVAPFQNETPIHDAGGAVIKYVTISPAGTDPATGKPLATVLVTKPGTGDPSLRDTIAIDVVPAQGNAIAGLTNGELGNKAMANLTPKSGNGPLYPELGGSNTQYSFQGLILGGRVSLNPMAFLAGANPLGRDALKLYAETALLGWKNYPGFYESRGERTPVMFGICLPTFDKLDFLTLEVEYFSSRTLPYFERRSFENLPQPGTHKGEVETIWDDQRRARDDFKWVLATKRSFRSWGLVFQAGTDHTKLADQSGEAFFDVMSRPSQWYTQVRFVAGIR